jgi:hypothetical protein
LAQSNTNDDDASCAGFNRSQLINFFSKKPHVRRDSACHFLGPLLLTPLIAAFFLGSNPFKEKDNKNTNELLS